MTEVYRLTGHDFKLRHYPAAVVQFEILLLPTAPVAAVTDSDLQPCDTPSLVS
jgi:hypothetical protein